MSTGFTRLCIVQYLSIVYLDTTGYIDAAYISGCEAPYNYY